MYHKLREKKMGEYGTMPTRQKWKKTSLEFVMKCTCNVKLTMWLNSQHRSSQSQCQFHAAHVLSCWLNMQIVMNKTYLLRRYASIFRNRLFYWIVYFSLSCISALFIWVYVCVCVTIIVAYRGIQMSYVLQNGPFWWSYKQSRG